LALAVLGRRVSPVARDASGESSPRGFIFDDIFQRRYDESLVDEAPAHLRALYRSLPPSMRLAMEVHRRRDEYDVIVTWSERLTLSLMAIQALTRTGKPHVAMMYWFSRPSVRAPMLAFGRSLHAIITWTSVQRRYAIERLHVPPARIHLVKHYVDTRFWSRRGATPLGEGICAAGAEMRDYPTLIEALRGTDIRCHIATDHVRVDRLGFARRVSAARFERTSGPNVSVGRMAAPGLRGLYARSRFVVVPLEASDTDNGITVLLEAMAMGKAVICSRTEGQVDVIQNGATGIFVPQGDARALRETMLSLYADPARCERIGAAARAYVEEHHAIEKFTSEVKNAIVASLGRVVC
jgi:glycosyltransferase involved in cell wall biosynthesis